MRATCSRSPLASFLFEERAHRALISRWFEGVNEIAKPFRKNFRPKFPVMRHARREDVMAKESMPAFPKIPVHHSVNMMEMDGLKRFQELVGSMEKSCPLFDRERADIFDPDAPDSFQLGVFHQRFGHVAQGRLPPRLA